ncbi:MAG TPA: type IV pilus modification protein PilV [Gammaproteobacteria bacterium]|nr:type IV pilus modification protein PilV [Gammaproteobacteria bacterium]
MIRDPSMPGHGGWTLIEVLVALAIFAIGVLGLAKLQMVSLHQDRSAYLRTQADRLGYDMLDRMRVNRDQAASGSYDMSMASQPPSGTTVTDCDTSTCTPAQITAWDLSQWLALVRTDLPGGEAAVTTTPHNSWSRVTVTISWQKGTGANSTRRPTVSVRTSL